jgi:hypothetical protein
MTATIPQPQRRPRCRFLTWSRGEVVLLAVLALVLAMWGALRLASILATAVEVTISHPSTTGAAVVYHATITNGEQARRIQRILNDDAPLCPLLTCGSAPACSTGPDEDRRFYTFDFRFSVAGVPTQTFTAGRGCFMSMKTLGVPSLDTRLDPLDAAGWSALLGISPALPETPEPS